MNRIEALFKEKEEHVLSLYFTAGFPQLDSTLPMIQHLEAAGADIIEIGFPFSDPLADGPVIQQSSAKAIENGMTLSVLFEQLKDIRKEVKIPLILMGYMNPVLQFGEENFAKKCAETGIDGVILPDCPVDYYEEHLKVLFDRYHLANILLVTPETPVDRIRYLDAVSSGFIYIVSSNSITGSDRSPSDQTAYFNKIKELNLKNPSLIGFGIRDRETCQNACKYANGAIIGSALIQHIASKGTDQQSIHSFIQTFQS